MKSPEGAEVRIGERFVLRVREGHLLEDGRPVALGGRALDVLCVLAEHAPGIASKRELLERAWPGVVVEEGNLATQVLALRKVLGAGTIVNVSGRGYRLDATMVHVGAAASDHPSRAGRLLERDEPLRALSSVLALARCGSGQVAVVAGEAGIGKSALCEALLSAALGVRILRGGCEALFSPRPLGPLQDIADALGPDVTSLIGRVPDRAALFATVAQRLAARPTVWLIEDLHWADTATLDLVKFLGRRLAGWPLLLLLTYRDDELGVQHPLRQVLGDLPAGAPRLKLVALSADAVAEMARSSGREAGDLHAASAGNPFLVTELLESPGLPVAVRDAVAARMARQAVAVREMLELVAIEPARVDLGLLDSLGRWPADTIDDALAGGLAVSDGSTLAFRHELARLAVQQSIPPHRARRLHAQMLKALQDRADARFDPTRQLHHAQCAGLVPEVRRLAPLAGREAAERGAHRQAAALYACALDAMDGDAEPARRAELIDLQCDELYLAGNEPSIIERRQQALDLWRRLGRRREEGRTLRLLSRQYWSLGDGREAIRHADAALSLLAPLQDDAEYGWALSTRSQLYMLASAHRDAVALGVQAIVLAERLGEPGLLAHALNNVGTSKVFVGKVESGIADLERSLTIARTNRFDDHAARALVNLVVTLTDMRRYADAEAIHAQAAEFFAHRDLDSYRDYVAGWRARLQFERGRWSEAQAEARQVVDTPFELNRLQPLLLLGRLAAYRGEPAPLGWLERAETLAQRSGELQRLVPVALARAETEWVATGKFASTEELHTLFERARHEGAREHIDELGYWLWRAGTAPVDGIDAAGPRGLQIRGQWHEAAQRWSELGSPVGLCQALSEGDATAINEARRLAMELGANGWLKRLRAHP